MLPSFIFEKYLLYLLLFGRPEREELKGKGLKRKQTMTGILNIVCIYIYIYIHRMYILYNRVYRPIIKYIIIKIFEYFYSSYISFLDLSL